MIIWSIFAHSPCSSLSLFCALSLSLGPEECVGYNSRLTSGFNYGTLFGIVLHLAAAAHQTLKPTLKRTIHNKPKGHAYSPRERAFTHYVLVIKYEAIPALQLNSFLFLCVCFNTCTCQIKSFCCLKELKVPKETMSQI